MKTRIKKIRKDRHLTQVEFGEKIGVKGNTITNYENGLRNPTDAVLLSICREFSVNENWLRTGEGEPYFDKNKDKEISDMLKDIQISDEESFKRRFISALTNLDEDGWHMLENLIDDISGKNMD